MHDGQERDLDTTRSCGLVVVVVGRQRLRELPGDGGRVNPRVARREAAPSLTLRVPGGGGRDVGGRAGGTNLR